MKERIIGLTYGDIAGVGPEILKKTLENWNFKFKPHIFGSEILLKNYLSKIIMTDILHKKYIIGKETKSTGLHSYHCLKLAIHAALKKEVSAVFTGPVSKNAINKAGFNFKGQTDEIAKLSKINPKDVIMTFIERDFRIALFTRHIALRDINKILSIENLERFILILNHELKAKLKIQKPRIAILGLNPHASENGLFGNEEKNIILPVVRKLERKNINASGPLSPDATLAMAGRNYLKNKKQDHDIYVSMYHDQALSVFKAVTGFRGVNVTLGLPFLRVSVDHGTGFNIAGKNIASNESLVSALRFLENYLISDKTSALEA